MDHVVSEPEELFGANANYIDHANHLLIVGRPPHGSLSQSV